MTDPNEVQKKISNVGTTVDTTSTTTSSSGAALATRCKVAQGQLSLQTGVAA